MMTLDKINYGADAIRPYGPGKFDSMMDSFVYGLSLDGCDEETGSVEEDGWYGLLRGWTIPSDADLTKDERAVFASHVGAIICEDSQGFVTVDYYATPEELNEAWNAIESA